MRSVAKDMLCDNRECLPGLLLSTPHNYAGCAETPASAKCNEVLVVTTTHTLLTQPTVNRCLSRCLELARSNSRCTSSRSGRPSRDHVVRAFGARVVSKPL